MKHLPALLLGAALLATLSFGPHPKQTGIMFPTSSFHAEAPIATYKISQGDRLIIHLGGSLLLCRGPACPMPVKPDPASAKARHLVAELGAIEYKLPLTAWLPFYQFGMIEAKVPVTFTRDGKKAGSWPNGDDIPADALTVDIEVSRVGLIPLGPFDARVEYVVLQEAKAGIIHRINEANQEHALRAMRDRTSK